MILSANSPETNSPGITVQRDRKGVAGLFVRSEFEIPEELRDEIGELLEEDVEPPKEVTAIRYYDGTLRFQYCPEIVEEPLEPTPLLSALDDFASRVRRLRAPDPSLEENTAELRKELARWVTERKDELKAIGDLRNEIGVDFLTGLRTDVENRGGPDTAEMVEEFLGAIEPIIDEAKQQTVIDQINEIVEQNLPVFIYFENYGILDSAIWLPRFLEDLSQNPTDSRVRTINAMFSHVGLDPKEITELAQEQAGETRRHGFQNQPTPEEIAADQERKDRRAILLNSASIDISREFCEWWSQRRHKIRFQADGDYFRIWVADERRQDVEIELESRSKGFQWFLSFYLVFLSESEDGHKDAILLLDEPGLHLHPTGQQELISFFEVLSKTNQLAYTTHSPFLIDGNHLHRVRPVTEDDTGHSRITAETWPKDRETIFPLQAAAGYAMVRGLFQHRKNVLVEGMSDFYYLHALSQQCARSGRTSLPSDIYITPCGGTKHVGHFASLFLGDEVRPIVLLDGDDAGRARHDALIKELYVDHKSSVVMLDEVLGRVGQEVEIEDILGESIVISGLASVLEKPLKLNKADRSAGSLPSQVKAAANRGDVKLPGGWKASVALHLVSSWAEEGSTLSDEVLDKAALLFSELNVRFDEAGV